MYASRVYSRRAIRKLSLIFYLKSVSINTSTQTLAFGGAVLNANDSAIAAATYTIGGYKALKRFLAKLLLQVFGCVLILPQRVEVPTILSCLRTTYVFF